MYGDAFIIHCKKGGEEGIVVVDGGPSSKGRLNVFNYEVENYNPIDLMILLAGFYYSKRKRWIPACQC